METLYDVATHEGGGIVLKNKYHSPAYSLEKKGFVRQIDRFPYRPHYIITEAGLAYWRAFQQSFAPDSLKAAVLSLPEIVKVENVLPAEGG